MVNELGFTQYGYRGNKNEIGPIKKKRAPDITLPHRNGLTKYIRLVAQNIMNNIYI